MSASNNRFGRRTGQQDEGRPDPVVSFKPQAADEGEQRGPSFDRAANAAPRVERDDEADVGPALDRKDKAFAPRIRSAERPLYHHLFDDTVRRRRSRGWVVLASVAVIILAGAGYAWHSLMSRPAPSFAEATPALPPAQSLGDIGRVTTPASPASTSAPPSSAPAAREVATPPVPKSVPSEPPPPPRRTISEAAANPPAPSAPAPTAAVNPPPAANMTPANPPDVAAAAPPPPKRDAVKHPAPRKDAALAAPKPREQLLPPAQTESAPATPPVAAAAPPRYSGNPATAMPQPLAGPSVPPDRYAALPPASRPQPSFAAPATTLPPSSDSSNTVTVDGVTYVNGQEPRALGTVGQPPATADASPSPAAPATPGYSAPGYRVLPPDATNGVAPLPNDVVILPNGQIAVPSGPQ